MHRYRTKVEVEWIKFLVKNGIAKVAGEHVSLNQEDLSKFQVQNLQYHICKVILMEYTKTSR